MAGDGVDDERKDTGQSGKGDADGVVAGPDDQERANVPKWRM